MQYTIPTPLSRKFHTAFDRRRLEQLSMTADVERKLVLGERGGVHGAGL